MPSGRQGFTCSPRLHSDLGLHVQLHNLVTNDTCEAVGEGARFLPADPTTPPRMISPLAQVHDAGGAGRAADAIRWLGQPTVQLRAVLAVELERLTRA
jgi:hypothetical protein